MKQLVIVGAGGFAREVYWYAQESVGFGTSFEIKGFLDGDVKLDEAEYAKLEKPVVGDAGTYEISDEDVFVCAIGDPSVKKKLVERLVHLLIAQKMAKYVS